VGQRLVLQLPLPVAMKRVAVAVIAAAGCTTTSPLLDDHRQPGSGAATFAQDTYFTGVVAPYPTPEACVAAANPAEITSLYGCELELAFCAGGMAGLRQHDIVTEGTYRIDGDIVDATLGGIAVTLDTRTGAATNAMTDTYIPDTAERWMTWDFDVITCPDDQP
jgi:hypothetical protein